METPLTPLEFARRARKIHSAREAVIDGDLRLTYAQFGERVDRWSAALAKLGVRQGDRVGTIAPNSHQHLEQFYAVPQLGAALVPMNYRLTADDFVYLANHSGCKILCVHADFLETVDRVRHRMTSVQHFVALEGAREGWLGYERLLAAGDGHFEPVKVEETDLLAINYTSGTTAHRKA
jgi:fatty-acyl-CoA synthase